MRLFTGLDLPAEVVHNLEQLLERLRPTARIHWSLPANLHITTKFIGEWPEERLGELKAALAALESQPPIAVHIRKVGFFPNPHAPRVFWCGIEAPGLEALAEHTDGATAALGIARETRAFSPHLTLARIKEKAEPSTAARSRCGAALARFRAVPGGQLLSLPEHLEALRFRVH